METRVDEIVIIGYRGWCGMKWGSIFYEPSIFTSKVYILALDFSCPSNPMKISLKKVTLFDKFKMADFMYPEYTVLYNEHGRCV